MGMTDTAEFPGGTAVSGTSRPKRRMTARWRYTNRLNARASTGPKTVAGKATAARNALRHGLSLPVMADPTLAPEVEQVAREIEQSVAGERLDGECHALACEIADTMIDLRRVRLVKLPLVAEMDADIRNCAKPLRELTRLDRYERRALSRRKLAIRAFCEAVLALRVAQRARRQNKAMEGKAKDSSEAGPSAGSAATPSEQSRSAEQSQLAKQTRLAGQGRSAEQSDTRKVE
jgi:hypothetical protein